MTVPDALRQALARLWLSTAWVAELPVPDEMPDYAYRAYDAWRIYAKQVRRVVEARQALLDALGQPDPT